MIRLNLNIVFVQSKNHLSTKAIYFTAICIRIENRAKERTENSHRYSIRNCKQKKPINHYFPLVYCDYLWKC